jgi:uncharacterized protein YbjT (DUF2867 family)
MPSRPVVVIGATGKTGRRIVRLLADRAVPVRPASRRSAAPFDWTRPETWDAALDGAGAVYISYYPDLAVPGAQEAVAALVDRARRAGVGRLVLLSGRGERHAQACEAIVRDSGLAFTLVRCAWFAQNFSEGALRDAVLSGTLALPAGSVREPIVDADDIAEVAAAALVDHGHAGQLYEVTGPRLLGFDEMAESLSDALGRRVRYRPISLEVFRDGMTAAAGPEIAAVLTEIARETLDGRNQWLGDGVQRALGRPPRDFAEVCRRAAAAGAWRTAA